MAYNVDKRGSKDQRILYDYLYELYGDVKYEQHIPELNQRLDLYVPNLGIVIEYDGIQHHQFVEHFHKHLEEFEFNKKQDYKKDTYLIEHGIKIIRIPYNNMVKSKEELKQLIDSTPYPDIEYTPLILEKEDIFKKNLKVKQKKLRDEVRSKYKEPEDKKKARLEKERQIRKERYKQIKEKRKE